MENYHGKKLNICKNKDNLIILLNIKNQFLFNSYANTYQVIFIILEQFYQYMKYVCGLGFE